MEYFTIAVTVEDDSDSIYWSLAIGDFETEDVSGYIACSGNKILFVINDKQYGVSLKEMLNAIYSHVKEAR